MRLLRGLYWLEMEKSRISPLPPSWSSTTDGACASEFNEVVLKNPPHLGGGRLPS